MGTGLTAPTHEEVAWYEELDAYYSGGTVTVKELRDALSEFDDNAHVVISWDDTPTIAYKGLKSVSLRKGTPNKLPNDTAGFKFESDGPEAWVFISTAEE